LRVVSSVAAIHSEDRLGQPVTITPRAARDAFGVGRVLDRNLEIYRMKAGARFGGNATLKSSKTRTTVRVF